MKQEDVINSDQSWLEIAAGQHSAGRNGARKLQNSKGDIAFFKTPQLHVLGNEVLAYIMATHLNLPCAIVQFANLFETNGVSQKGILSFRITGIELVEWPLVPDKIKKNPRKYVMNAEDIAKIALFDVWTYNSDRSTANLILSPKKEWPNKYLIYMIDHEECFYGYNASCSRSETDAAWSNPSSFINIPEVKEAIKFSEITEFISEIEAIDDIKLKELINLVPQEYYTSDQADLVFAILKKRRDGLRLMIEDWCKKEGKA